MDCNTPGLFVRHQLPELAQTHIHRVCDTIQSSHPLLSPSPPAFNLSQHQGIFSESVLCIRWPKYWSFSFSINPSNGYSGLISFRMNWLDIFAVQGTLRSLLQHHSSKASILWCSAFFMFQFSHPYMRSVAQSCPILCDSMNCSTPGFPVHQQRYSNSMSFQS